MEQRSFEEALNAIFHDEKALSTFYSLEVKKEVNVFKIGGRKVFRTSDLLKKYLRFIDKVILRYLRQDKEVVHSFVKGKNTLSAVEKHRSSKYFFLTDIGSFYPNIKTDDVRKLLEENIESVPIIDFENHIDKIVELTCYQGSIPVGFSTSPRLSNAFLRSFDESMKKYCSQHALIYTRYADDLIVSGNTRGQLDNLRACVQNLLHQTASQNLQLKDSKTRIIHHGNRVKILGLVVLPNGDITIDAKYKKKLELSLFFYTHDKGKYESYLEEEFGGSEQSLFGMLHYAKSVAPSYMRKLQRKYGAYALRSLMEEKQHDH